MKRDMDLIRTILLEVEKLPLSGANSELEIPGHTPEEVTYHIMLCQEAGLLDAVDASSFDGTYWIPTRLTYQGHEFLDAARADTIWNQAKTSVLKTTGTLTLEALKVAMAVLMQKAITGH